MLRLIVFNLIEGKPALYKNIQEIRNNKEPNKYIVVRLGIYSPSRGTLI